LVPVKARRESNKNKQPTDQHLTRGAGNGAATSCAGGVGERGPCCGRLPPLSRHSKPQVPPLSNPSLSLLQPVIVCWGEQAGAGQADGRRCT
jgi:hypothetical protein